MRDSKTFAAVAALALLLAVAVAGPALGAGQSQSGSAATLAPPPQLAVLPTDGTWAAFSWSNGPNVDATPTFDVTGPALIDVTDIQITGDRFEVFDGATSLGQTSGVTEPDGGATGPFSAAACDSAFNNPVPNYSKGSFSIVGPGVHTIKIRNIRIPTNPTTFTGGNGCIRAVPLGPDLVVSSLTHSPVNPTTNDTIQFDATVRNDGNQAAGASTLMFAIGGETQGGVNTLFEVPSLNPGASFVVTRTANNLDAQNYLNTATADFATVVAETNEGNNTTTDSYTVTEAAVPAGIVYSILTAPSNGDLFEGDAAGNPVGSPLGAGATVGDPTRLVYVPDAGFEGQDSFTYRCTNNNIPPPNSSDATVDITVSSAGGGLELTVTIVGNGEVSLDVGGSVVAICTASPCVNSFGSGDLVKLQARPLGLSTFTGYSVDCSGTSQIFILNMGTSDKSCTATFNP